MSTWSETLPSISGNMMSNLVYNSFRSGDLKTIFARTAISLQQNSTVFKIKKSIAGHVLASYTAVIESLNILNSLFHLITVLRNAKNLCTTTKS